MNYVQTFWLDKVNKILQHLDKLTTSAECKAKAETLLQNIGEPIEEIQIQTYLDKTIPAALDQFKPDNPKKNRHLEHCHQALCGLFQEYKARVFEYRLTTFQVFPEESEFDDLSDPNLVFLFLSSALEYEFNRKTQDWIASNFKSNLGNHHLQHEVTFLAKVNRLQTGVPNFIEKIGGLPSIFIRDGFDQLNIKEKQTLCNTLKSTLETLLADVPKSESAIPGVNALLSVVEALSIVTTGTSIRSHEFTTTFERVLNYVRTQLSNIILDPTRQSPVVTPTQSPHGTLPPGVENSTSQAVLSQLQTATPTPPPEIPAVANNSPKTSQGDGWQYATGKKRPQQRRPKNQTTHTGSTRKPTYRQALMEHDNNRYSSLGPKKH